MNPERIRTDEEIITQGVGIEDIVPWKNRIVDFELGTEWHEGEILVRECCDGYFHCSLNKEQMAELIRQLTVLYRAQGEPR